VSATGSTVFYGPIGRLGWWTTAHFKLVAIAWAVVTHSGRVVFAAAALMVAVFFTLALSGPLPSKETCVILGIAVLLGRWARWLPKPLGRLVPDVRFGHA
jgi:RND superfamily putative drug exporter